MTTLEAKLRALEAEWYTKAHANPMSYELMDLIEGAAALGAAEAYEQAAQCVMPAANARPDCAMVLDLAAQMIRSLAARGEAVSSCRDCARLTGGHCWKHASFAASPHTPAPAGTSCLGHLKSIECRAQSHHRPHRHRYGLNPQLTDPDPGGTLISVSGLPPRGLTSGTDSPAGAEGQPAVRAGRSRTYSQRRSAATTIRSLELHMVDDPDDESVEYSKIELRSGYYADGKALSRDLRPEADETEFDNEDRLFVYDDGGSAAFWYYEWVAGPATDGATGLVVEEARYELIFEGWATKLDGVRHLYFSNDGYLFYPHYGSLVKALTTLFARFPGDE